jgi:hypothetical protein
MQLLIHSAFTNSILNCLLMSPRALSNSWLFWSSIQQILKYWQSQSYLMTDGQTDPVSGHYWDPRPIFLSLPWKLSSGIGSFLVWGALSDVRWVCNLRVQVLLCLAMAVTLRSKSCRTWDHIWLFHLRLGSLFDISYDSQDCSGTSLLHITPEYWMGTRACLNAEKEITSFPTRNLTIILYLPCL